MMMGRPVNANEEGRREKTAFEEAFFKKNLAGFLSPPPHLLLLVVIKL